MYNQEALPEWNSFFNYTYSRIKHFFREAGFVVQVERKKGIFWENIFIYGTKFKDVKGKIQFDPVLD